MVCLAGDVGWEIRGCAERRRKALAPPRLGEAAIPVTGSVQQQEMLPAEQHIPTGHKVLLSQAWPAPSLPGQALCWLQHALTKDILFLPRKGQSTSLSTFPLPTAQPLVFTSFCRLSVSLLRLLLGNVFGFLPRVRFSQMTVALTLLVELNEERPLWCDKLWRSGEVTESVLRNVSWKQR